MPSWRWNSHLCSDLSCHSWILFLSFFFFFCFLGPHPWHMEVLKLGDKSELQPLAYTTATATPDLSLVCNLHHSSQQGQILNPLSEARDLTRNIMVPHEISFHFATMGTPAIGFLSQWVTVETSCNILYTGNNAFQLHICYTKSFCNINKLDGFSLAITLLLFFLLFSFGSI